VPELRQPHVLVVVVGTNAGILENTQLPNPVNGGIGARMLL
jgi:hypothetical protein